MCHLKDSKIYTLLYYNVILIFQIDTFYFSDMQIPKKMFWLFNY